ncbi:hypothetical protein O181_132372 [Austropuccinia psidii MF-1]|uniref:Uncharacterized protein n=1 Tax=Austropuccinia psidii MF-1 TaxID=1389203 RepID=A0A9Q3QDV1_9BASI|nr:hypothetical protein [Austropuccinia psidii MF-1]
MSEFMLHRKSLRQCGDDLKHAVRRRTTEQSSTEDMLNILEEVTTRTKIGSSRVNLRTSQRVPSLPKHHPFSQYMSKKGEINEIDIEKEPNVEKDDIIEDNSDDKSSIFSESSKDIENINDTFDTMESYPHLPQLSTLFIKRSRFTTYENQTKQRERLYSW